MSDTLIGSEIGREIPLIVFDVESVGLQGEGYAVGYVVIFKGHEVGFDMFACPPCMAEGVDSDRLWISKHIPSLDVNCKDPFEMRQRFWSRWLQWKTYGAVLAADCAWPVESRFLAACIDDSPEERRFYGPYPLIEISTWIIAAGRDPMKANDRLERELPVHNPLADARQSARLLLEAIATTERRAP
jgi:hypothetical protein